MIWPLSKLRTDPQSAQWSNIRQLLISLQAEELFFLQHVVNMWKPHLTCQKSQTLSDLLTWSHSINLLKIDDLPKRSVHERNAKHKAWTCDRKIIILLNADTKKTIDDSHACFRMLTGAPDDFVLRSIRSDCRVSLSLGIIIFIVLIIECCEFRFWSGFKARCVWLAKHPQRRFIPWSKFMISDCESIIFHPDVRRYFACVTCFQDAFYQQTCLAQKMVKHWSIRSGRSTARKQQLQQRQ